MFERWNYEKMKPRNISGRCSYIYRSGMGPNLARGRYCIAESTPFWTLRISQPREDARNATGDCLFQPCLAISELCNLETNMQDLHLRFVRVMAADELCKTSVSAPRKRRRSVGRKLRLRWSGPLAKAPPAHGALRTYSRRGAKHCGVKRARRNENRRLG
jgi:hypothetical protein